MSRMLHFRLLFCIPFAATLLLCAATQSPLVRRGAAAQNLNTGEHSGSNAAKPAARPTPGTGRTAAEAGRTGGKTSFEDALELRRALPGLGRTTKAGPDTGGGRDEPAATGGGTTSEQNSPLQEYLVRHQADMSRYDATFTCPILELVGDGEFTVQGSYVTMTQGLTVRKAMLISNETGGMRSFALRLLDDDFIPNSRYRYQGSVYSFRLIEDGDDSYRVRAVNPDMECDINIRAIGSNPPWPCKKPRCK